MYSVCWRDERRQEDGPYDLYNKIRISGTHFSANWDRIRFSQLKLPNHKIKYDNARATTCIKFLTLLPMLLFAENKDHGQAPYSLHGYIYQQEHELFYAHDAWQPMRSSLSRSNTCRDLHTLVVSNSIFDSTLHLAWPESPTWSIMKY